MRPREKQWKDQLAKWRFRKHLNAQDAAYICHLLQEGERLGTPGTVLFNFTPKTMVDVESYIRKAKNVANKDALMRHLDPNDTPPHISWQPADQAHTTQQPQLDQRSSQAEQWQQVLRTNTYHTPAVAAHVTHVSGSHSSAVDTGLAAQDGVAHNAISVEGNHGLVSSFEHVLGPSQSPSLATNGDDYEIDEQMLDSDGMDTPSDSGSSLVVPQYFPDVEIEVDSGPPLMSPAKGSMPFSSVISSSPVIINLDVDVVDVKVSQWLGKFEPVAADTQSQFRITLFMQRCCAAAIYSGQADKYERKRWESIALAGTAFGSLLSQSAWDTLTALVQMFIILGMFGHYYVVQDILEVANDAVNGRSTGTETPSYVTVLSLALRFLRSIPKPGTKPSYNLQDLAQMEQLATQSFQDRPQFQLTATYLYAWALLEMKEYPEALQKLNNMRDDCEEVFGRGALPTINCIGTLARALARNRKHKAAASTYRDVNARIQEYFDPEHPQCWDARYRQAIFDRESFALEPNLELRRIQYLNVATTLQETLEWRCEVLGESNPQVLQNFNALRKLLVGLNLASDETTLQEVRQLCLTGNGHPHDGDYVPGPSKL